MVQYYEVCNQSEGKSPKTVQWYSQNLGHFCRYLSDMHLSDAIGDVSLKVLRQYVLYLMSRNKIDRHGRSPAKAEPLSPVTVHCHVRTLRAFFSWLAREELIDRNPAAGLRPPKVPKTVVSVLTDEEIKRILDSFRRSDPCGMRNQTIFMMLIDTGMRIGEATGLQMQDLHLNDGFVKVMGKGRRERIVPVGYNAQRALQRYIFRYRPGPASPVIDNVFLSIHGERLSENSMKLAFQNAARRAAVPRLHAHLCRHTFATRFLTNGGDIFALQQILGHSTLEMVRHYASLSSDHIRQQHQRFSPLDRMRLGRGY